LLALIVTGAGIAVGALRWTGESPYGSDNDEYRLVARSLVNGAGPVSAGEGTKYPVGYPLVLAACDALHLPVDGSALGLNALLVFVIAALVGWTTWTAAPWPLPWLAAFFVVTSSELWSSTFTIMPDVLFVALLALMLRVLWVRRSTRPASLTLCLSGLTLGMMMVRTAGLFMVVPATAGLLTGPPSQKRWAWLPGAVAVACIVLNLTLVASLPPHTTG